MNEKPIPCHNCITYAICNSRMMSGNDMPVHKILWLLKKCSILHEYSLKKVSPSVFHTTKTKHYKINIVVKIARFYNLSEHIYRQPHDEHEIKGSMKQ